MFGLKPKLFLNIFQRISHLECKVILMIFPIDLGDIQYCGYKILVLIRLPQNQWSQLAQLPLAH